MSERGSSRENANDAGWSMVREPQGRVLIGPNGVRVAPSFSSGRGASHAREADLARQPFARALAIAALRARLGRVPSVLDATAGLGADAWLAAALGARVWLLERNATVHAVLGDALLRAAEDDDARVRQIAKRLTLLPSSATLADAPPPDVVYLDPMYPQRRVRGGRRKGIEALQGIVGHDHDNDGLLDAALSVAGTRVVVKRPSGAAPLASQAGHVRNDTIDGPNTRYDRYLPIRDQS